MVAAHDLTGVLNGCAVTPSSGLTIAIAAGIVIVSGTVVAVTATTKTHDALQAQARYDLVVCSSAGVVSITKGTYAANPVFPAISGALLAAVYIPATGATPTVLSTWITDKRMMIRQPDEFLVSIF